MRMPIRLGLLIGFGLAIPCGAPAQTDPQSSPQTTLTAASEKAGHRVIANKDRIIEIKSSGTLQASAIEGRLVIAASDIVIDGGGLTLVGGEGDPKSFQGIAISATGVSNVTLKNFKACGWETGLKVVDGKGWTIENCDFSGNFHDPEFGWGENGRRGGIVLERVSGSVLRRNRANRVWDGCVLVDSDQNQLIDNDFSHTSNTCLKLWHSSRNTVRKNQLSYGIRIKPGEVHARDSTSVLIESGSNENQFVENDCTHGGDGIFIRVLNGWCSVGNLFERNDCSYANNNGIECWARDNIFRGNKANHCSYGFWLGGSDHTILEGNEANFNGLKEGHHNSPHLPGNSHAGIVFMFGPSSHTVARRNTCIGNNGAGIAAIGDQASRGQKWKARHWIIEDNHLSRNRWGVFLEYADWISLRGNRFSERGTAGNDNSIAAVQVEDGVTRLIQNGSPLDPTDGADRSFDQFISLDGPMSALVGERVHFSPRALPLAPGATVTWDLGDGTTADTTGVDHVFKSPGFYRIGFNLTAPAGTNLGFRDFFVINDVKEIGTEGNPNDWSIEDFHDRRRSQDQISQAEFTEDRDDRLVGKSCLKVLIRPYAGFRVALTYPKTRDAAWPLAGKKKLVFWMKVINEDVTGWQGGPFLSLEGDSGKPCYIEPKSGLDLMRQLENNEGRDGWRRMEISLAGNDQWQVDGDLPETVKAISLAFDSWGAPTLRLWIDGLTFE